MPENPTDAITVPPDAITDGQVFVDCSHCGGTHRHGVTPRLRPGHVESRVADCELPGYDIRLAREAVRTVQRERIGTAIVPAAIATDFAATDAVAGAHATVHERSPPAFRIESTYTRDGGLNGEVADVLAAHDLRIWSVGFDTRSLTIVPAADFQWNYNQEGSSG